MCWGCHDVIEIFLNYIGETLIRGLSCVEPSFTQDTLIIGHCRYLSIEMLMETYLWWGLHLIRGSLLNQQLKSLSMARNVCVVKPNNWPPLYTLVLPIFIMAWKVRGWTIGHRRANTITHRHLVYAVTKVPFCAICHEFITNHCTPKTPSDRDTLQRVMTNDSLHYVCNIGIIVEWNLAIRTKTCFLKINISLPHSIDANHFIKML